MRLKNVLLGFIPKRYEITLFSIELFQVWVIHLAWDGNLDKPRSLKGLPDHYINTVPFSHSRSIWVLCYDLRVLWPAKSTIKSNAKPLGFRLLTVMDWNCKCSKSQSPSSNSCKTVDFESSQSKKNPRHFGFEATFFATLYSESLLFGRPGLDSRPLQTLRGYNFLALGPGGSKTNFFERFDLSLLR